MCMRLCMRLCTVCECIRWSISSKKQPASHTAHCVCLAAIATTSCLLGKHTATRACKFLNRWIVFYMYFLGFVVLLHLLFIFSVFTFLFVAFLVALWVLRFYIWHFCVAIPPDACSPKPLAVCVCVCVWDEFDIRDECHVRCGDVLIDRSARDIHKLVIYCIWQHVCYVSAKIVAGHSPSCSCQLPVAVAV